MKESWEIPEKNVGIHKEKTLRNPWLNLLPENFSGELLEKALSLIPSKSTNACMENHMEKQ